MISNLESARTLIQADLDHARSVVALWTDQVTELEKALEQINLVDSSRTALRGASQERKGTVPVLTAGNGVDGKARRGRKPKQAAVASGSKLTKQRGAKSASSTAKSKAAEDSGQATGRPSRRATARRDKKRTVSGTAKYRDPNSDRTWTGHGRRPG